MSRSRPCAVTAAPPRGGSMCCDGARHTGRRSSPSNSPRATASALTGTNLSIIGGRDLPLHVVAEIMDVCPRRSPRRRVCMIQTAKPESTICPPKPPRVAVLALAHRPAAANKLLGTFTRILHKASEDIHWNGRYCFAGPSQMTNEPYLTEIKRNEGGHFESLSPLSNA
jgi:hypothetical protein